MPGYAQYAFKAPHMKGVQVAFLSHVGVPCLATVKKGAEDTCLVDAHLGIHCDQLVLPHPTE